MRTSRIIKKIVWYYSLMVAVPLFLAISGILILYMKILSLNEFQRVSLSQWKRYVDDTFIIFKPNKHRDEDNEYYQSGIFVRKFD